MGVDVTVLVSVVVTDVVAVVVTVDVSDVVRLVVCDDVTVVVTVEVIVVRKHSAKVPSRKESITSFKVSIDEHPTSTRNPSKSQISEPTSVVLVYLCTMSLRIPAEDLHRVALDVSSTTTVIPCSSTQVKLRGWSSQASPRSFRTAT